jgi:hypothetical protein
VKNINAQADAEARKTQADAENEQGGEKTELL